MNRAQSKGLASSPKAKEKSLWLGISDIKTEGDYLYESTYDPFDVSKDYHNFNMGEPSTTTGGKNDCVYMKDTLQYKWTMDNCHKSHHYACEKPPVKDSTRATSKFACLYYSSIRQLAQTIKFYKPPQSLTQFCQVPDHRFGLNSAFYGFLAIPIRSTFS